MIVRRGCDHVGARISPTITQVWIDSQSRGQIGPNLGRTDRNVTDLAATLDKAWAQVEATEECEEKRHICPPTPQLLQPS
jgi:hypothetical protein